MNITSKARQLANYIAQMNPDFFIEIQPGEMQYNHVGALLTDVILQAGLNYTSIVKPRVKRVLLNYPEAYTTERFEKVVFQDGLENVIHWRHSVKINRMFELLNFLKRNNLNDCAEIKSFLLSKQNQLSLLDVHGVGYKTLDYLLKLLGFDNVAVDRHIYSFVEMANIGIVDYHYTKRVVEYAADFLEIRRTSLDYSIWYFMSQKDKKPSLSSQLELWA